MAQGALGDSWLVSALNILLPFPEELKKVIVSDRHGDKGTLTMLTTRGQRNIVTLSDVFLRGVRSVCYDSCRLGAPNAGAYCPLHSWKHTLE